jgi:hypothetical protein
MTGWKGRGVRLRVGIALGTSAVRAIGVRGGLVEWSLEAELEDGEPLAPALTEFLRRSPASRKWPSPRITLALPPGLAQVKRVGRAARNRRHARPVRRDS